MRDSTWVGQSFHYLAYFHPNLWLDIRKERLKMVPRNSPNAKCLRVERLRLQLFRITSDLQYLSCLVQIILYITGTSFKYQAFHGPLDGFMWCLYFFEGNARLFFSTKDHAPRRDSDWQCWCPRHGHVRNETTIEVQGLAEKENLPSSLISWNGSKEGPTISLLA